MEDNILIAEFLGWECHNGVYANPEDGNDLWTAEGMRFNSNWEWLMDAVDSIESLGYGVTIGMGSHCIIQNNWKEDLEEIHSMTDNSKLLCTVNAVVKFIKWHNNKNHGK